MAVAPTSSDVRGWSKVDFADRGFEVPLMVAPDLGPDPLDVVVVQAVAYVWAVTGRDFASMPVELLDLARQAVRMRVEQQVMEQQDDAVESASDGLSSFSAGNYSETRIDPTKRGSVKILNAWGALADVLWLLMTGERYEYWVGFLSEVDWSESYGWYEAFPGSWWGGGGGWSP